MGSGILAQLDAGGPQVTMAGVIAAIGALGSSSAAVLVVYFFLQFFKRKSLDFERRDEERTRRMEEFIARQGEMLKETREAIRDNTAAMREIITRLTPTSPAKRT